MTRSDQELRVLLVDEEPDAWADLLAQAELRPSHATADAALELLERVRVDAALVVVTATATLELVGRIAARHPRLALVVLATKGATDAGAAADAGACALVPLPVDPSELGKAVRRGVALSQGVAPSEEGSASAEIVGTSKVMDGVRDLIARLAPGTTTVLVRGESGTGKELVARALHTSSDRREGPFVKIHCAALPDTLLESELFGYERGAFTGATSRKPGRVEAAQGGTLFLDEIGDISAATQVKLLRLLQDREFERLGDNKSISVDARFVVATHRDLESMVKQGEFREDLFYRLNVVPLWVPPLRARRGDVRLLAEHFCALFGAANNNPAITLSDDALSALAAHRWPGNVRELRNLIERLVVLSLGPVIGAEDVERELRGQTPFATAMASAAQTSASLASEVIPLQAEVRKAERRALERALAHTEGNRSLAARLLGINRGTLYNKLREHGLE